MSGFLQIMKLFIEINTYINRIVYFLVLLAFLSAAL